ncbi:MAG: elongation factor G [Alphaproteobacteria bacterium]|nr:elongation factor G [Alphaproteobacteria bacterium]
MGARTPPGPRSVALIGPYSSGKTTLFENLLWAAGSISRKGAVDEGNSVGDASPEARERRMSTELNAGTVKFMDDTFTFLDCPGSIELLQETLNALVGVDAAVVVCEPIVDKALALAPLMKALEDDGVPHMLFVNKIDKATGSVDDLIAALQPVSKRPLVLRHVPLMAGERVTGYVDLASERAYLYRPGNASELVEGPGPAADEVTLARGQMLEKLADFDDALMEKVLEEVTPERDEVYRNLTRDFQEGLIVPVLLGAALHEHGVRRLLKALRHEVPPAAAAAKRRGVAGDGTAAQVLKTYHSQHGGKLSLARVWSGTVKDGQTLAGQRVAGVLRMLGQGTTKQAEATAGDVVALARMEHAHTGDTLAEAKTAVLLRKATALTPVYSLAIGTAKREDDVKLSGALARLAEEDPSLRYGHAEDTHQLVLRGQGDIHLKVAADRLKHKYGLTVTTTRPRVPYKEAIRKGLQQHGRFKRQSGGHGQFGDVHLDIKPLPRGSGFHFGDRVVGGAVPRNFIPAVEEGVAEYLKRGPLGFRVVDISVDLFDGQYHAVDSSEMSFKQAARVAMTEAMPKCEPVLLEPILQVEIAVPQEYTPKANQLVSSRRGQILGFDARPGWDGWDVVTAHMPEAEVHDMIIDLRSLTQGAGSYTAKFDHLQELTGRLADAVIEQNRAEAAA